MLSYIKKYLTRLREMLIFSPRLEKLSVLSTSLDIFDIRQHYIHILYKRVLENVIKRAFGELSNVFRDKFNKISSQQSMNARFFLSHN